MEEEDLSLESASRSSGTETSISADSFDSDENEMEHYDISSGSYVDFFKVLRRIQNNDPTLKEIFVHYCDMQSSGNDQISFHYTLHHIHTHPGQLVDALASNTVIETVSIEPYPCEWSVENVTLAGAIGSLKSLRRLVVLGDEDEGSVAMSYAYLAHARQVTHLELRTASWGYLSQENTVMLDLILRNHPNLESICLSYPHYQSRSVEATTYLFPSFLPHLPQLRSVRVDGICSPPESFPALCDTHNKLSCVELDVFRGEWEDKDYRLLFRSLRNMPCLQYLGIRRCPSTRAFYENLACLFNTNTSLNDLYLSGNIHSQLDVINPILDSRYATKQLKSLSLFFEGVITDDLFGERLCSFLRTAPVLEDLCLMIYLSDGEWLRVAEGFSSCTALKKLKIGSQTQMNFFQSSPVVRHFYEKLSTSPTLEKYEYDGAHGYANMLDFIEMLGIETKIRKLDFCGVEGTAEDRNKLLAILKKNYTLTALSYVKHETENGGIVRSKEDASIQMILELNRCGRRYMVEHNPRREQGFAVLEKISNGNIDTAVDSTIDLRLSCIYFHLRENPSLLNVDYSTLTSPVAGRMAKKLLRTSREDRSPTKFKNLDRALDA